MRIKAFMKSSNAPSTLTFVEQKVENVGHYSATVGQPHLPKMYKNNNKTLQKLRNCLQVFQVVQVFQDCEVWLKL